MKLRPFMASFLGGLLPFQLFVSITQSRCKFLIGNRFVFHQHNYGTQTCYDYVGGFT